MDVKDRRGRRQVVLCEVVVQPGARCPKIRYARGRGDARANHHDDVLATAIADGRRHARQVEAAQHRGRLLVPAVLHRQRTAQLVSNALHRPCLCEVRASFRDCFRVRMDKVLGGPLRKKDGSVAAVPTTARVVGLFFASSNAETSAAAARVADVCAKTLARGQVLWVVYILLDADDAAACAAMPDVFVALAQPGVRERLWADLQLTASPCLVLYEGDTGRLITKNGLRVIREDPEGVKYPWTPQTLDALLGDVLVQSSGREANRREVLAGKHVGLLFAAQWSAPSLKLVEKLYVAYKSIRQRRSGLLTFVLLLCRPVLSGQSRVLSALTHSVVQISRLCLCQPTKHQKSTKGL